eukprot:scaffold765_cov345-Prasinococcus_capsulatus_cf.AAC.1
MEGYDDMDHLMPKHGARKAVRFGRDLRLQEVRKLLCSAQALPVKVASSPEVNEPDLISLQQGRLLSLGQRTAAQPVGRGAFTLCSSSPTISEPLPIPNLCLAGSLPTQQNALVSLDPNSPVANSMGGANAVNELSTWPEYHN